MNVPYVRIDLSIGPFLKVLDKYLDERNCTDVALIFDDPVRKYLEIDTFINIINIFSFSEVDEALYYWIDTERVRMVITDTLDKTSAERLKALRPIPNNYAIIGSTTAVLKLFHLVSMYIHDSFLQGPRRNLQ